MNGIPVLAADPTPKDQLQTLNALETEAVFVEADDYDDYDDDDDDFEDYRAGGGGGGGGFGSKLLGVDDSKLQQMTASIKISHSVANAVSKMEKIEQSKRTMVQGKDDRATLEQVLDPRTRLILFKFLSTGLCESIDGCLSTGKEANVYYAKAGTSSTIQNVLKGFGGNNPPMEQNLSTILANQSIVDSKAERLITEFAIKIYKTSILVFKDRDKYVTGEFRWKNGYCKSNPRKMVQVWAEKELRNYKRIYNSGIPCPQPILLKRNVLVMEFLGTGDGWPSPRLKDAVLTEKRLREAYVQCIMILRQLYVKCRLVHGDLSEYNLLWHNNQVYVIDVSQSVETDHPSALDFLRKDVANVNDFFRKHKVAQLNVMTTRQLFEYVTQSESIVDGRSESKSDASQQENEFDNDWSQLERIMNEVDKQADAVSSMSDKERKDSEQRILVDEAVFMNSFLPRSLNQIQESDVKKLQLGDVENVYAAAVASMLPTLSNPARDELTKNDDNMDCATTTSPVNENTNQTEIPITKSVQFAVDDDNDDDVNDENDSTNLEYDSDGDNDDDYDDEDDENAERSKYIKVPKTPEELAAEKLEQKQLRKQNKKVVKEEKKEQRKTKLKKKDKKRAIKKASGPNSKKS
jgi:RIO kinase 1